MPSKDKAIYLFASGDSRESANITCWPAQTDMEAALKRECEALGYDLKRAHPVDPEKGHGFLASQREGMNAVASIPKNAKVIVAEAVWQYSHHILPGLTTHDGDILTVANWSGQWPGLVGMLNLNGSLTKAGIPYSTLWSDDFTDDFFRTSLSNWLETGIIAHDSSHLAKYDPEHTTGEGKRLAVEIADDLRKAKSIMGVFDEGCMGMFNAIIPDELLMPLGVFKERLSQSALYHETLQVSDSEASEVYRWLLSKGLKFHLGTDEKTELTEKQVLTQCRMYVAAVRMADAFDCETIGIQYQQGLKDILPASDLVEGILNNSDRPPVRRNDGTIIRPGIPVTHFNEVDECAGLDALLIQRVHSTLGQPLETTLHDIRWGDYDHSGSTDDFVWVLEISGAAPPEHHLGGWAGSDVMRQPAMYFPSGGGTLSGVAKPGEIIWSRLFVQDQRLHMDIGLGKAIELPERETLRRREGTTREWPIMHAVLNDISRDQMMGRHKSNHIQVVYSHSPDDARHALAVRAHLAHELGINVSVAGMGTPT